jgi:hypothetical protein
MQVDACAPRARFATVGISACNLNLSVPGTYYLDFSILDTATNIRVTRTRTVIVLPACPFSEPTCADLTCGSGGTCLGGEQKIRENSAPLLNLTRSANQDANGVVQVAMGTAYEACEPGQVGIRLSAVFHTRMDSSFPAVTSSSLNNPTWLSQLALS